ncbi:MAG: chemotaxis protein CheB [Thermodesulfobacteriota bacterium]
MKDDIHSEPEYPTTQNPDPLPLYYVGIGASAGGLEAIETFIKNVHYKSGLAFIVVQHLSPDYKSLMVELLSKKTEMPVHRAEDGMAVAPDSVYLIPPKKNLTIFHGKLLLKDQDHSKGLNLPIDIFLRSLAEDQGPKAIAIILSGTGSDGMRGIRAIKENGGMVMVQNEESAKFDGMPRSAISTGLADFILPPEKMPAQIQSYIRHPYVSRTERSDTLLTDEDSLTRIFALLREKSKVDFTYYKPSTVVRRIERRMTVNQILVLSDYVKYLESFPGEVAALYRELLIGVTSFFRDPEAFAELETKWLPQLIKREVDREIRFWTAGCSTGEEAYTLAILSRECMEKLGKSADVKIFATDIDRDAIQRASTGEYPESIAGDLSPALLAKYFYRKSDNFQINRNIREMVVFARHNIIKDPPFTNIDLLSCRNLLIYLQPVLQKKALELFNFSLTPQGLLFLGTSETTGDMADYFDPLHHKWKIYQSRGRRKPKDTGDALVTLPRILEKPAREYRRVGGRMLKSYEEERALDRLIQALSKDYIPLVVLVNETLEILYVAGSTEGYFKVPEGKMDNDISKMAVKDLAIPLATGIQKVFKTGEEIQYTNIRIKRNGSEKKIGMRIRALPLKKGQEPLVAVLLEEMIRRDREPIADSRTFDVGKETAQRILDLEHELQFTKENLQATIEELETSNEELQATNEELLASNEELQSTNEELQSVNEELYTVNAEYQSKIVELTELNNDMDNLLTSTDIGTLFLDEDLEIRKFTLKIQDVYKIREGDVGRPISHLNHRLADIDPFEIFEEVHETGRRLDQEVCTEDGNWYLMRVLPYKIGPSAFSGVVVTFIEITRLKAAQKALNASEAQLHQTAHTLRQERDLMDRVMNTSPVAITMVDKSGSIIFANAPARNLFNLQKEELHGRAFNAPAWKITDYDGNSLPDEQLPFEIVRRTCKPVFNIRHAVEDSAGNRLLLTINASPLFDETGTFDGMVAVIEDITEKIRIARRAESSEARYRELFDRMMNGFALHEIVWDEAGRPIDYVFLEANDAFEKMTGLSRKAIIGKKVTEVIPDIRESDFDWIGRYGKVVQTGEPIQFESYAEALDRWYSVSAYRPSANHFATIFDDITTKRKNTEALRRIEWLMTPKTSRKSTADPGQPYGDLTALNLSRRILDTMGAGLLRDLAADYLGLLETSGAIYEKNGDYAMGLFSSGWCRTLDLASRELCDTDDNREALSCGKWLCHESCWREASLAAIQAGEAVDVPCNGGLRLYAVPVRCGEEIVGAINFGYGDPPKDGAVLKEIAGRYRVDPELLRKEAETYESRPPFIIEYAKQRLHRVARMIGAIMGEKR